MNGIKILAYFLLLITLLPPNANCHCCGGCHKCCDFSSSSSAECECECESKPAEVDNPCKEHISSAQTTESNTKAENVSSTPTAASNGKKELTSSTQTTTSVAETEHSPRTSKDHISTDSSTPTATSNNAKTTTKSEQRIPLAPRLGAPRAARPRNLNPNDNPFKVPAKQNATSTTQKSGQHSASSTNSAPNSIMYCDCNPVPNMMGSYLVDTPDECRVVEDDCVLHKLDCPPEASNQQCSDSIVAGKYKQKKGKN